MLACNKKIVGQPGKRECRQNIQKMSEKESPKLSGGAENTISGHFWQFLPMWLMLWFGDPVQHSPICTNLGHVFRFSLWKKTCLNKSQAKAVSQGKFHTPPSKKRVCFLEGPLPLKRNENRRCVNREVQTVNWEAGQEGAAWKGRISCELKAEIAHKPWIREGLGLNREGQTVN